MALLGGAAGGEAAEAAAAARRQQSVNGFTFFQLAQNLASCVWFFVALAVPMHDTPGGARGTLVQVWLQLALLALALATFVYVDRQEVARRRRGGGEAEGAEEEEGGVGSKR